MEYKKIIPYIYAENELECSILRKAIEYEQNGADELFLYNYSRISKEKEEFLLTVKQVVQKVELPVLIGCDIERLEDIKKALYTGAKRVVIPYECIADIELLREGAQRFGTDKLVIEFDASEEKLPDGLRDKTLALQLKEAGAAALLLKHISVSELMLERISKEPLPVYLRDSLLRNDMATLLSTNNVIGVATNYYEKKDIFKIKRILKEAGIQTNVFESQIAFSEFKKDAAGLIPVIAQDYKSGQVLMLAYMNEEAYNRTIETGRMTYYSRSREALWTKGETSGHYQFVKSLSIDCDADTILAKVLQIGPACHTGNNSCFYRELVKREYEDTNPLMVLNEVYDVIAGRKQHPKEGSYTNYLFEKGIDKILKKCGEEAAEIIIAAKNPEPEELKYEISDFLYHMMVLMVERGLCWEDIVEELAHRR